VNCDFFRFFWAYSCALSTCKFNSTFICLQKAISP
jgi:hypothetical protein